MENRVVIFVDDEVELGPLIKLWFDDDVKNSSFELYFCNSGKECLDLLKDQADKNILIFSDINMPEMNGLELLKCVKSKYPNISINMISAYNTPKHLDEASALGADKFFVKPYPFKEIKTYIYGHYGISVE